MVVRCDIEGCVRLWQPGDPAMQLKHEIRLDHGQMLALKLLNKYLAAGFDLHAQVKQARWKWEAAPCPIAVISHDRNPKDRKFVYVNAAFTLVTGYAKDEVIGQLAKLLDGPRIYTEVSHECEKCLAR